MSPRTPLSFFAPAPGLGVGSLARHRDFGLSGSRKPELIERMAGMLSWSCVAEGFSIRWVVATLLAVALVLQGDLLQGDSLWGQEPLRVSGGAGRALPPLRAVREESPELVARTSAIAPGEVSETEQVGSPVTEDSAPVALSAPRGTPSGAAPGLTIEPPKAARDRRANPFSLPADVPRNTLLALGLVIGSFLVLAWFVKRHQPRSFAALPEEAVELLGRIAMDQKQHLQLIRLGRKLVLMSVSASGCRTVSEVTEPAEVEHLLTLCQSRRGNSASEAFRQVLTRAEKEPSGAGFLGNASGSKPSELGRDDGDSRRRRAWFEA